MWSGRSRKSFFDPPGAAAEGRSCAAHRRCSVRARRILWQRSPRSCRSSAGRQTGGGVALLVAVCDVAHVPLLKFRSQISLPVICTAEWLITLRSPRCVSRCGYVHTGCPGRPLRPRFAHLLQCAEWPAPGPAVSQHDARACDCRFHPERDTPKQKTTLQCDQLKSQQMQRTPGMSRRSGAGDNSGRGGGGPAVPTAVRSDGKPPSVSGRPVNAYLHQAALTRDERAGHRRGSGQDPPHSCHAGCHIHISSLQLWRTAHCRIFACRITATDRLQSRPRGAKVTCGM